MSKEKECLVCEKIFFAYPYCFKSAKYCSRKCSLQKTSIGGKSYSNKFPKNNIPWNKGMKGYHLCLTKEGLENKRKWSAKEKSHEIKEKIRLSHIKRLENYQRITPIHNLIRKSAAYKHWRTLVFQRDNYICQICFTKGGKLNADHIKPFSKFPELRFDVKNGRTLCKDCHKKTPTYGVKGLKC